MKNKRFYFEFSSVLMQDLFETLNYADQYYLNLHRDEVLRPKRSSINQRFVVFLPEYLVSNVVVLIHSFDFLNPSDHFHRHHHLLRLLLQLRYYNPDHPLLHHHQLELKITMRNFPIEYIRVLLPLESLILRPSSSPSKSRYCSLSNFN